MKVTVGGHAGQMWREPAGKGVPEAVAEVLREHREPCPPTPEDVCVCIGRACVHVCRGWGESSEVSYNLRGEEGYVEPCGRGKAVISSSGVGATDCR